MRQSVKPNSARATVRGARKVALLGAGWLSDRSLLCVVAHSVDITSFERATVVRDGSTLELEVFSARHPADHDVLATDAGAWPMYQVDSHHTGALPLTVDPSRRGSPITENRKQSPCHPPRGQPAAPPTRPLRSILLDSRV